MMDKGKFYDAVRSGKLLGPVLEPKEFAGVDAILSEALDRKWPVSWTAYALATAYHETAHTMEPVKEFGGPKYYTRMYDITGTRPTLAKENGNTKPGDGILYCGRGFVQLTWKNNYEKAERLLGIKGLVANPELARNLNNAAKILGSGMELGWFTGKSMGHYLPKATVPATHVQFKAARRVINGVDKDDLIADYAVSFQNYLKTGGY
jgi:putative chitinase